jgi:hypothetical protein
VRLGKPDVPLMYRDVAPKHGTVRIPGIVITQIAPS